MASLEKYYTWSIGSGKLFGTFDGTAARSDCVLSPNFLRKRQKISPPVAGGLRVWLKESLITI